MVSVVLYSAQFLLCFNEVKTGWSFGLKKFGLYINRIVYGFCRHV